jgi:hypothetical protein
MDAGARVIPADRLARPEGFQICCHRSQANLRCGTIMAEALGRAKWWKVHVTRALVRMSGEPLWTAESDLGPSNARNERGTEPGAWGNRWSRWDLCRGPGASRVRALV